MNKDKYLSKNPLMRYFLDRFARDIVQIAKALEPRRILDMGCGEGFLTERIAKKLPSARITALDISQGSIDYAKRHAKMGNITYGVGDIGELKEDGFDLTICTEVLEHIPDFRKALKNLLDSTGRYLLVSVPNEPWFSIANILRLKNLSRLGNDPEHVHRWTRRRFARILSRYGRIELVRTSSFWIIVLLKKGAYMKSSLE